MQKKINRKFNTLLNRLNLALNDKASISIISNINYLDNVYPFPKIILGDKRLRRVLISAGIHGDEPASVETICKFLETEKYSAYLDKWEITILPCINPYGFENNTRENYSKKDLNRYFKESSSPIEIELVKSVIKPSYFDLTLELHEDVDSDGYYLFQKSNKTKGLEYGTQIINSVKKIIPINLNKIIDGMNAEKGIIHKLKNINEMEWWPMAGYSLSRNCGHCFTLETPTKFPLSTRVNAHLEALDSALLNYST